MAPRTVEQGMSHSTLEIAPKTEAASYAYSVPDNYSPPFSTHDPASHAQWDASQPYSPRRRILTRWYFLVLYGLLIALIAGIIGGVIGKSIESNRNNDVATVNTSCPTSNNDNSNTIDLNNHSATPTLSATSSAPTSTGFVRTLSVPKTGCEPATDVQKSFKAFSTFIKAGYTTFCNTGWWSDDLFGISVATPSDCVEACAYYNQFRSSNERPCAGGGFIPAWLDQARAMKEDGGIPYNCFLKANDSSVGRNDRDIEVVALCMDGFCNNVLSPGS